MKSFIKILAALTISTILIVTAFAQGNIPPRTMREIKRHMVDWYALHAVNGPYWVDSALYAAAGGSIAVWDSLWAHLDTLTALQLSAVLFDWVDTTTAKIPTAEMSDDVDTTGTKIAAALALRDNIASDSQWTYIRVYNAGDDTVIVTAERVSIFSDSWPQLIITNTDGDSIDFGLDADGLTIDANGDQVDVIGAMDIVGNVDVNGTLETAGAITCGGEFSSLNAEITNAIQLKYDVSHYCDIGVNAGGDVAIEATGGNIVFTSTTIGGDLGVSHYDTLHTSGSFVVNDDLTVNGTFNKLRTGKEDTDTCTSPYLYRVDISPPFPDTNYVVMAQGYGGFMITLWADSSLYVDRFWVGVNNADRFHWIAVHE